MYVYICKYIQVHILPTLKYYNVTWLETRTLTFCTNFRRANFFLLMATMGTIFLQVAIVHFYIHIGIYLKLTHRYSTRLHKH